MSETYNSVALAFLNERGFACEAEPDWIVGRKPDFFCSGPLDLWVEVKHLEEGQRHRDLFQIFDYLRKHVHRVGGKGYGIAFASSAATTKDAKVALGLANGAMLSLEMRAHRAVWVLIPEAPIYGERLTFTVRTKDGPVWIVSAKSSTQQYGYPFYLHPDPWHQRIAVKDQDGTVMYHELDRFAMQERYRLALAIHPDDRPFRLLSATPAGAAQRLTNRERIRSAISDAVNQLKSGLKHRQVPACVFVFQSGVLVPEDTEILSALLGDLTYRFRPDDFQNGQTGLAGNASWQRAKNTSISAATFFRNNGVPTTFRNPYATKPLQPSVFGGREWHIHVTNDEFKCSLTDNETPAGERP